MASHETLGPEELAVVVNDDDPMSVAIGEYYRTRRRIPVQNVVHVRFPPGVAELSPAEFAGVKARADAQTPARVQAYALTWAAPYRVGCMSVTAAFAFGYDEAFCAEGCRPTRPSPYFDSASRAPHADLGLRPTMALAGASLQDVKDLIDRGAAADATFPAGTAYLVSTSDATRNVRARGFPQTVSRLGKAVRMELVHGDSLRDREDVLFYFTGLARVADLETNRFVPGAIADHLTSAGGRLTDGVLQMSSLRWLEAGATGSYGTVAEPCNFPQKFPDPGVVVRHYLDGETLVEAYWKSVAWPGQGVFIGEPLSRPFGPRLRETLPAP